MMERELKTELPLDDEPEIHLADITEKDAEGLEVPQRASRKKKLVMLGALLALCAVTALGGYYLLAGKRVQVNAKRKPGERITSGADLQKAAYDSLKGSLTEPVADTNGAASNIGTGQAATLAMAGVAVTPAPVAERMTATNTRDGIAQTVAPPPDVYATTNAPRAATNNPSVNANADGNTQAVVSNAKPKVGASIVFTSQPKAEPAANNTSSKAIANQDESAPTLRRAIAAPAFGAMLPVRLLGMLYTLRPNTLVRLELTRDIQTDSHTLKRGTVFVGNLQGAQLDRAFIQLKGFIEPESKRFVPLTGELLGNDGGAGLPGKRRRVSSIWGKVLDRAAQSGTQILTGVLGRQNSSVIVTADPYGTYRSANGADAAQSQGQQSFVEVAAGTVGFVLVTGLPKESNGDIYLAERNNDAESTNDISDAELATLLADAKPEEIRAALPRMSPPLRRVAESVLKEVEAKPAR